eukprot:1152579-Pelagomonas_calceolata.AAC.6
MVPPTTGTKISNGTQHGLALARPAWPWCRIMSDIIRHWLEESGLAPTKAIEEDFANGYMFGQLLHHYNMQPDFDKFEDRRAPESMVNNYTRLQVHHACIIHAQVCSLLVPQSDMQIVNRVTLTLTQVHVVQK